MISEAVIAGETCAKMESLSFQCIRYLKSQKLKIITKI